MGKYAIRLCVAGLFLSVLAGCATTRPQSVGDNEYLITGRSMSSTEAREQAVKGANRHCRKQGATARIIEVTELCRGRIEEQVQAHYLCE